MICKVKTVKKQTLPLVSDAAEKKESNLFLMFSVQFNQFNQSTGCDCTLIKLVKLVVVFSEFHLA